MSYTSNVPSVVQCMHCLSTQVVAGTHDFDRFGEHTAAEAAARAALSDVWHVL